MGGIELVEPYGEAKTDYFFKLVYAYMYRIAKLRDLYFKVLYFRTTANEISHRFLFNFSSIWFYKPNSAYVPASYALTPQPYLPLFPRIYHIIKALENFN